MNLLYKENLIKYILFISLLVKLIILFFFEKIGFPDSAWYVDTATLIYENNFILHSDEDINFPLLLYFYSLAVPLKAFFGIKAFATFDVILATFTILVIYKISDQIFNNKITANIAALIVAFYPFFNFYSIMIMSETTYIFLLYISLYYAILFVKYNQVNYLVIFSTFFALSTLVRFINLGMILFFIILFVITSYRKNKNYINVIKVIFITSITYFIVMSPWWIRNYYVYNQFTPTTPSYTGHVLYAGNNPLNKSGGGIGGVDVDYSHFNHIKDPIKKDEAQIKAAIDWIKNNPTDWLILEFKKLIRFYRITPYATQYQLWYYKLISIFSYGIVFILFLYGLYNFRNKFWEFSPMILYAILLTGVHMVFIASIRYRLPIEPFMIIIASGVLTKIMERYATKNN